MWSLGGLGAQGWDGSQGTVLGVLSCPQSGAGGLTGTHQGPEGMADGCPAPCPSFLLHQCPPLIP